MSNICCQEWVIFMASMSNIYGQVWVVFVAKYEYYLWSSMNNICGQVWVLLYEYLCDTGGGGEFFYNIIMIFFTYIFEWMSKHKIVANNLYCRVQ